MPLDGTADKVLILVSVQANVPVQDLDWKPPKAITSTAVLVTLFNLANFAIKILT